MQAARSGGDAVPPLRLPAPRQVQLEKAIKEALWEGLSLFGSNFLLTFNIRAGVGLLMHLIKMALKRPGSLSELRRLVGEKHLIFREDAVRLGLFIGGFTGLYTSLEKILKLLSRSANANSADVHRISPQSKRTGLQTEADAEATWHAFAAGTISGVSLLALDGERRRTLALYVWARGLQCLYNGFKARGWFHFWGSHWNHGDSLLFALSTAQVMYGYAMRPETLPPSYYRFIVTTGPISDYVLQQTRRSIRGLPINVKEVLEYAKKHGANVVPAPITSANPSIIPCSVLHPHNKFCTAQIRQTFTDAFSRSFPLYFSLNIVPTIAMRFGKFLANPLTILWRSVTAATTSTSFLATLVAGYMAVICGQRKLVVKDSKFMYWVAGFIASASIFIEKKSRRSELALYVFPRAADSLYMILRDHRLLFGIPNGDVLLFGLSMGVVMHAFRHEHQAMSGIFYKIMRRFVGTPDAEREKSLDTPHPKGSPDAAAAGPAGGGAADEVDAEVAA